MSRVQIAWGLDLESGLMKYIDEVESGMACGCICPGCRTELIAKKGEVMEWHFAHSNAVDCAGESALHMAAKQILVEEASRKKNLKLPSSKTYEVTKYNNIGQIVSEKYQNNTISFAMTEGWEEKQLSNGTITDVMLLGQDDHTLAVEIFVTHKKDNDAIAQYLDLRQDSLEINLSDLNWNANHEAIRSALIKSASRKWIYCNEIEQLHSFFKQRVHDEVAKQNRTHSEMLSNFVATLKSDDCLNRIVINWPLLDEQITVQSSNNIILTGTARAVPKVTKISSDWLPDQNVLGWKCQAIAGASTEIEVLVCLQNTNIALMAKKKPLLVLHFGVQSGVLGLGLLPNCEWFFIDHWKRELRKRAELNLEGKIRSLNRKLEDSRDRADDIRRMSDWEKISVITNRLKIDKPRGLGKFERHWNTRTYIWKGFCWTDKIAKKKGKKVNVGNLAEDKWIYRLMGYPEDPDSKIKRSKDLWFWLRNIEDSGYIYHTGNQWFYICDEIPDSFNPWEITKTTDTSMCSERYY